MTLFILSNFSANKNDFFFVEIIEFLQLLFNIQIIIMYIYKIDSFVNRKTYTSRL